MKGDIYRTLVLIRPFLDHQSRDHNNIFKARSLDIEDSNFMSRSLEPSCVKACNNFFRFIRDYFRMVLPVIMSIIGYEFALAMSERELMMLVLKGERRLRFTKMDIRLALLSQACVRDCDDKTVFSSSMNR